jgi:hypothetical protein
MQPVEGALTPIHDDFPRMLGYLVEAAEEHLTGARPSKRSESDAARQHERAVEEWASFTG